MQITTTATSNPVSQGLSLEQVIAWHHRGDIARAEAGYQSILAQYPHQFEALHMLGVLYMQSGRMPQAGIYLQRALSIQASGTVVYHYGYWLMQEKRYAQALPYFDKVLDVEPGQIQAWRQRVYAYFYLERWQESLKDCEGLLVVAPQLTRVRLLRVRLLTLLKQWVPAILAYQELQGLITESSEVYHLGASIYFNQKLGGRAILELQHAIRLEPNRFEFHLEEGNAWILRLLEPASSDANDCSDVEIKADSKYLLPGLGRAIDCFRRALELEPQHPQANYNLALCLLMIGEWGEGWERYEYRWEVKRLQKTLGERSFHTPAWDGVGRLKGKRLLLHAEQGIGDIFQFCRYAQLLHDLGAYVMLLVPEELQRFLRSSLAGVDEWVDEGLMPSFDLHCPLLSLPRALGLLPQIIPPTRAYLTPPTSEQMEWQQRLQAYGKQTSGSWRIGLSWMGSAVHYNDRNRSLPLPVLLECLPMGVHQGFCLHHQMSEVDQSLLAKTNNIYFLMPGRDWSQTAGLIMNLDLVITIDTGVAHLAAALGKPTWILTNWFSDFRWLLGRTDTPWYETVRLFRQNRHGDWQGLLTEVRSALAIFTPSP